MDVRTLRSFLRVAEAGNLSRAAEALNIVQPALSRQIALLEAELGTQLLVRHRRGVALTEAGMALRQHAQGILAAVDEARQAVSALGSEPTGTVALGLPTSMLYVLSGTLVEAYRRRYPRVALRLHEAIGHVIEALMEDGRLDVAVIIEPRAIRGVAQETLVSEAMCLAGPPAASLDMARPVSAAEVAAVPMMMFSPQNRVRTRLETLLARDGLSLAPAALEVEGQPLAFDLVRRGLGYTVLPWCAVEAEIAAGRMSGAPIEDFAISWILAVNRARAGAPAVRAMVDMLRDTVAARVADGTWKMAKPPVPPADRGRADRRA